MTLHHHLVLGLPPIFKKNPPTPQVAYQCNRVHPYAHLLHTKVLKHFLYIYDVDVGCSLRWFGASTMTLHHHLVSSLPQFSKQSILTSSGVSV